MKKEVFVGKAQEVLAGHGVELNKKEVGSVTDELFQLVLDLVAAGEEVPVGALGKMTSAERAARQGRNPSSGEPIEIPATVAPKFKPSKAFKDTLKNK